MKRGGCNTPADLAKALGLKAYSSPRRVARWLEGTASPDYELTIALLDLVGAINWDALAEPGSPSAMQAELERVKRRTKEIEALLQAFPEEPQSDGPGKRSSRRS